METFVIKQVKKMTQIFDLEKRLLIGEEAREEEEEDELDEDAKEVYLDNEGNLESSETVVID